MPEKISGNLPVGVFFSGLPKGIDPAVDSNGFNTLKLQQNKIFLKDFENVHTSCSDKLLRFVQPS